MKMSEIVSDDAKPRQLGEVTFRRVRREFRPCRTGRRATNVRTMSRTRALPVVSIAALGLAIGACSSSSKPPSSITTSSITTSTAASTTTPAVPAAHWAPLPAAPIAGRIAAGAVWTGREMVVWGGVARGSGTPSAASDGAAYNPTTRQWRAIASPPSGVLGDAGNAAVWTGARAVFWAGNSSDGPAVGATYDPASDTWQRLPKGPLGAREGYASAWTGHELLLLGGTSGDQFARPVAAAVNPSTGAWRQLHAFDALAGLRLGRAVVVGGRVYASGTVSDCAQLGSACRHEHAIFLEYDPSADAVHQLDLSHAPSLPIATVGSTASDVVFDATSRGAERIVRYDVPNGTWTKGPAVSCVPVTPFYSQSAWLEGADAYVVGCGATRLAVYRVSTNRWTTIDAGASPLNSRAGSAIVWTGNQLIAWSGTVALPENPTPADGSAIGLG